MDEHGTLFKVGGGSFTFVPDIFVSVSHIFALVTPEILETVIDKQFDCSQSDDE